MPYYLLLSLWQQLIKIGGNLYGPERVLNPKLLNAFNISSTEIIILEQFTKSSICCNKNGFTKIGF